MMMKTRADAATLLTMLLGVFLAACTGAEEEPAAPGEQQDKEEEIDWMSIADRSQESLLREYWSDQHYFTQNNGEHIGFNYWWNAHALDVWVDAYLRTGDVEYTELMDQLLAGCRRKNGDTMWNTFYDDMEWMALACLRAYDATGEEKYKTLSRMLWDEIKVGWSDINHGGIAWASGSPGSKNACSNAPAVILAARLYQEDRRQEDLDWALKIYQWQKKYLVDPARGVVWDGYGNFNENNIYTYNQGTYLGASLELFEILGEESYMREAIRTANYVVHDRDRFSPEGILRGENSGDGGLFKGIFIRYLTQLALAPALDGMTRASYLHYLDDNARSLWTTATLKPDILFGHTWRGVPDGKTIDCSIHLSAVMMLEARYAVDGLMGEETSSSPAFNSISQTQKR
ncbi:glycosyl hydrolase family 76 [Echinicola soli]|uniref:Glycosyl hydrolase family 76 n=1 Tax=Echinicola soli TaxID=2591634 RepID=A0A514CN28_9BACT|nr:glycoside hydrolase family 76 protein [Echinicola soli]QDH81225.1 glycosyl hydrolase family 76 [Echinicola soli]